VPRKLANKASLQKVDYRYNIRGWLKSINDVEELTPSSDPTDLFAFKISYNEVENDLNNMITPAVASINNLNGWRDASGSCL